MMAVALLLQTLRIAIPYLLAAAGGVLSERAGVIALALEGMMLGGAFGAVMASHFAGSAWAGIAGAMAVGALVAAIMAFCAVRYAANQVVVGVALNLLMIGATRFFLRLTFDSASNSPRVAGFGSDGPLTGMLSALANPLLWIGLAALPALSWLLFRTPFGLRVRAIGEKPEAAATLGIRVPVLRTQALILSGMLASLGGAYLALDQHQFTDSMTAGRGFIALAAVIFGRWIPWRVAAACLFFAAAETVQIQLQGTQAIPSQFVSIIPYLLTIIALIGVVGKSVPPAALGKAS